MTELEKLEYTRAFMEKLANGINPIDDIPIPDGDLAAQPRMSRCFAYVSELLRQVIAQGGIREAAPPKPRKRDFYLDEQARAALRPSDTPLSVREISQYLATLIDTETTKTVSATLINRWLMQIGMLEEVTLSDDNRRKLPTAQGRELGIITEERSGQYGSFTAVLYTAQAQQFIFDHIEVFSHPATPDEPTQPAVARAGRAWTEEQERELTTLFGKGVRIDDIAAHLQRTPGAIRARLVKLGLIADRNDAE